MELQVNNARWLALAAAMLCFLTRANGATLPTTIQSVSSEFTSINRGAAHCVDGSGLNANNPPGHDTDPTHMWLNTGDGSFGGGADPHPNGDLAQITFDLGAFSSVDSFRVWNYNEVNSGNGQSFTNRSVQTLTISIATVAGGPYTLLTDPNSNTTTFTFLQAPGTSGYTGQLFTFLAPFQAEFVRFDIKTNYGPDPGPAEHGFVGLSEIQFFGSPVPEPSTWMLLGVGLASLVALRRRTRLALPTSKSA